MADKKYYWLKLKKDFFKRHDIKIIESMENGKDYVLFYLKLLCESVDHDGSLRFSETIPYDDKMLATITGTNIDIVRSAMKVFTSLQMVEILDDQTIFMNEVEKMIGGESESAERVRRHRALKAQSLHCNALVTNGNTDIDKEQEIDLDLHTEREKEGVSAEGGATPTTPKRFKKPTLEEVQSYCRDRQNDVDAQRFIDYYSSNGWKVGKNPMKDWKAAVRTWEHTEKKKPKQYESSFDADEFFNAAVKKGLGGN